MRQSRELTRRLPDEAATRALGAALGGALDREPGAAFVTLGGELGAGKTTLVRGMLAALGVAGPVRSPTYTLVESYVAGARRIHHLDWYRLADGDELEQLGFRDLLDGGGWVLVEWPERVPAVAASADLALRLELPAGGGRVARLSGQTAKGARIVAALMQDPALG